MPTDALKQYDHTNSLVYFPKTLFQSLHRGHTTMKEKSVWFLGWFAALLACFRWFRPLSCRYVRPWDSVVDIAALNGMIIWILNNPEWEVRRRYKRRLYLKQLARSLVAPWITARVTQPQSGSVRRAMLAAGFQVVVQKKQEKASAKKNVVFVAKRMTERHSTDAASASVPVSLFIWDEVHMWSMPARTRLTKLGVFDSYDKQQNFVIL